MEFRVNLSDKEQAVLDRAKKAAHDLGSEAIHHLWKDSTAVQRMQAGLESIKELVELHFAKQQDDEDKQEEGK